LQSKRVLKGEMALSNAAPYPKGKAFWQKAFQTFIALLPQSAYVAVLFFVLPQLVFSLYYGIVADQAWWQVLALSQDTLGTQGRVDIIDVFNAITPTLFLLIGVFFVAAIFFVAGYLTLCCTANLYFSGRPKPSLPRAFMMSLPHLPGALLGALLLFVVVGLIQLTFPPLVLLLVPLGMTPIFMVCENRGVFSAMKYCATLKYMPPLPGSKLGMFFQLMTITAIFYLGLMLAVFVSQFFLTFDQWLGFHHNFWSERLGEAPYTAAFAISQVFDSLAGSAFLVLYICMTANAYFWVKSYLGRLPEEGLQA